MHVFVLGSDKKPLDPCPAARARWLLSQGRAAVFRRYPFTIILKDRTAEESVVHEHRVKIDPGSKTTGMAILQEETAQVVFAAEIAHRGEVVKMRMDKRESLRRSRRWRKTRYRSPRFSNRKHMAYWLQPSRESRVSNITTWVNRLRRFCPVVFISMELVKFDMQKMQNPEISGIEYQQGELQGYEVREYLLEKWNRACAYCGKTEVSLQIEHIKARSKGGSSRVSNLTLACEKCNQRKGNRSVEEFLKNKPDALAKILRQAKSPLKDAAAVNATRWALWRRLSATGLPVECGSGALTKFNRTERGLAKSHWADALCVGSSTPLSVVTGGVVVLHIKATGHGQRQRCRTDKYGFPKHFTMREKFFAGFRTGDIVRAVVALGKYAGIREGRVAIRRSSRFLLNKVNVYHKNLTIIQHADGYDYSCNKDSHMTEVSHAGE